MFCIRPIPMKHESLTGYLHRLAMRNRYSALSGFCKLLNINANHYNRNIFSKETIVKIERYTGIEVDDLHLMMNTPLIKKIGEGLSHLFILRNGIKFCPCCIREVAHHRQLWFLHSYNVCHEHGTLLIDRCQECGSNIRMRSLIEGVCSCGFKYISSDLQQVECLEYHNQLYHSLLNDTPILFNDTGSFTYGQFLKLAQFSFHFIEGMNDFTGTQTIIQPFHKKKGRQQSNSDMMISLGNVSWMYSEFPNNFYMVLDSFFKKSDRATYVTKSTFEKLFEDSCYSKILGAYEHYWLRKLNKGEVRRDFSVFKKNADLLNKREFIRKEEVKSLYSNEKIMALGAMGKIKIQNSNSERRYLIDGASLAKFQSTMDEFVNKNKAAEMLGIKRYSVYLLIESGLIREHDVKASRYKLLKKSELQDLLMKIYQRGTISTNVHKMLSFNKALITHSVNGLTMARLIQFILNGQLRPVFTSETGGFSCCFIRAGELNKCIEIIKKEHRDNQGLYREEVMKILKVGEQTMKDLHARGVLVPDKIVQWKDGRLRYLYSRERIEEYKVGRIR